MTLETIKMSKLRKALEHIGYPGETIDELFELVELITDLPPGAILTKVDQLSQNAVGCGVRTITRNEEHRAEGLLNAFHINEYKGGIPNPDRVDTQIVVDGRFIPIYASCSIIVYPMEGHN